MYREAGGEELVRRIMEEKRAEGTTVYTIVHHRETPLRIAKRTVDAAPVWATEAVHARASGLPFEEIKPGSNLDQRNKVVYYACRLDRAPHRENAGRFLEFLASKTAGDIFRSHGFLPHEP
jgi:ABC-type molybdate transport system substrate-binding protein